VSGLAEAGLAGRRSSLLGPTLGRPAGVGPAVAAAQAAGHGVRVEEGVLAARLSMAADKSSIIETRPPKVIVEPDRGSVTVLVFGGTITPLLGGVELEAQACGPLDDVRAFEITAGDAWRC